MAGKDLSEKKLEDYNDVFADILNTLLFKKDLILPSLLEDGPSESVYKAAEKICVDSTGIHLNIIKRQALCLLVLEWKMKLKKKITCQ